MVSNSSRSRSLSRKRPCRFRRIRDFSRSVPAHDLSIRADRGRRHGRASGRWRARAEVGPSDDLVVFGDGPIGLLMLPMGRVFGPRSITVVSTTSHRLELARRLGADAVMDVGSEPNLRGALTRQGDAALGLDAGQRSRNLDLDRLVTEKIELRGALGSPGVWPTVIDLIESSRVNPSPLVSDHLPLSAFRDGIDRVKARTGVKLVVQHDWAG